MEPELLRVILLTIIENVRLVNALVKLGHSEL
jgi:hypothetical protein